MKNLVIFILVLTFWSCSSNKSITEEQPILQSSPTIINTPFEIHLAKGTEHNHPTFAFWIEDLEGNYLETIFVTGFIASGKFRHGELEAGKWKAEEGEVRRPAALPYWAHKRNIKAEDGLYIPSPATAVPDALSGATPKGSFVLQTGTKVNSGKFRVLMEINQAWDSNKFWTNNKFPDDKNYFASLQPALVYAATIDLDADEKEFYLDSIGHSNPSGTDGKLYTDISNHTTAKEIVRTVSVQLK